VVGGRFWLTLFGICIGLGVGAFLLFWLLGTVWYSWGLLAMLIFVGAAALLFGWTVDRRDEKARRELAAMVPDQHAE
jgi:hypothetical protein